MQQHYNPYHLYGGIFVPHHLLSSVKLSAGAKLLYSLLAARADSRGETLLNISWAAAALGTEEHQVLRLMNELDTLHLIGTQRHVLGTEFIRCFFPLPAWLDAKPAHTGSEPPSTAPVERSGSLDQAPAPLTRLRAAIPRSKQAQAGTSPTRHRNSETSASSRSCHSKETCVKWAIFCKERLHHPIRNEFRLAQKLHRTGEQDEEISLWLEEQEREQQAA
jgi:hypothetical protein